METIHDLYREICSLVLFRMGEDNPLFGLIECLAQSKADDPSPALLRRASFCFRQLLEQAGQLSFHGDLWQGCLTWFLLTNENPFTLAREISGCQPNGLDALAQRELAVFWKLFHLDLCSTGKTFGGMLTTLPKLKGQTATNTAGGQITRLSAQLAQAADSQTFYQLLSEHYAVCGAGMFGVSYAFRLEDGEALSLRPIFRPDPVRLSDLVGYAEQKAQLVRNTLAFLEGKPANNVLLYGDSGSGKSTCVRGILQEFSGRGLRLIELYKHQFRRLADVLALVKDRGCKFLLFIDDLSFEDFEVEYKALKALIEGGLEARPANLLIYATSNRRHLIKETWNDRTDMEHSGDVHRSDTLEEKLSLANRFGLAINFSSPNRQQYHEMVLTLAQRAGVSMEKTTLFRLADAWEIRHGGVSGRTAQQFINDLVCGVEAL